jgi:hypothetical protein
LNIAWPFARQPEFAHRCAKKQSRSRDAAEAGSITGQGAKSMDMFKAMESAPNIYVAGEHQCHMSSWHCAIDGMERGCDTARGQTEHELDGGRK